MKVGTKYTAALGYALEQENEALRVKVEKLEAERSELQKAQDNRSSFRRQNPNSWSPVVAKASEVKGYLRPTESSLRRSGLDPRKTPQATGTLPKSSNKDEVASLQPEVPATSRSPEPPSQRECTEYACHCGGEDGQCPYVQRPCQCILCRHFGFYGPKHQNKDNPLCDRTKLNDSGLYETPAGRVWIRFDKIFKILEAGYKLAQNALWHAVRIYWPKLQRQHYIYGPWQVRFEWKVLAAIFCSDNGQTRRTRAPNDHSDMCDMPPELVNQAIMAMNDYRNALAHRGPMSPESADRHLRTAQQLACMLRDEPRANQIHAKRDRLKEHVQESLEEVIRYEPLSQLPGARDWALHHQRCFYEVAGAIRSYNEKVEFIRSINELPGYQYCNPEKLYHPAVLKAAVSWNRKL